MSKTIDLDKLLAYLKDRADSHRHDAQRCSCLTTKVETLAYADAYDELADALKAGAV